LKDAQANLATLTVTVSGAITTGETDGLIGSSPNAKFNTVLYTPRTTTDGADVIEFQTQGSIQEVGIDFTRDGQRYYQPLELDTTGKYTLACEDCGSDFSLPYLIDSA
jgi:hypothetical protein